MSATRAQVDGFDIVEMLNDIRRDDELKKLTSAHGNTYHALGDVLCWVVQAQNALTNERAERRFFEDQLHRALERAEKLEASVDKNPRVRKALPRLDVFEIDGWRCAYCRCQLSETTGHADHLIPFSSGGSDEIANLVAACASCNISKGAKTPEEWKSEFNDEWLSAHMSRRYQRENGVILPGDPGHPAEQTN